MRVFSVASVGKQSKRGPSVFRSSRWMERTVASLPDVAAHATAARKVTIRLMLNAALAKTKSASTVVRPRSFTLRRPAIVFNHAKTRSMRSRAC